MTYVASNPEGTRWWALEHEGDYKDGDLLFKVEILRPDLTRVTEVKNNA